MKSKKSVGTGSPEEDARRAGLRYVTDSQEGISRKKRGKGFIYYAPGGDRITDKDILERIRSLVIPPAWQKVWICTDPRGHLQATGYDARGRKQYKYHPGWSSTRNHSKFYRLKDFMKALPAVREQVNKDLNKRSICKEKVVATVVRLMEVAYIRIGNNEYAKQNNSFGLTTMRDRHVKINGSSIRFSFNGKSGIKHDLQLKDRRLARIVKQCRDIPGYELFQYYDEAGGKHAIESGDINRYLKEITGKDFTAKDFRTWAGSMMAFRRLWTLPQPATKTTVKKEIVATVKEVSQQLGNTPAVCRKYYIHPLLVEASESGDLPEFYKKCSRKRDKFHREEEFEECMLLEFLLQA